MKKGIAMIGAVLCVISVICVLCVLMLMTSKTSTSKENLRTYTKSQYGRIEHGAVVITDDGKYRIEKNTENQLCFNMYYDVSLEYEVLKNVTKHRRKGNYYYIKSDEGYAIVDIESEISRVFVTVPQNEFVKYSGSVDENGEKIYRSRFIEDRHIVYLDSFEDFSENEKQILR